MPPELRCARVPGTPNQLQRRVRKCVRALAPLTGMAREYSPPVLLVALSLQLNRLGRAQVSSVLLQPEDVRELVMDACELGAAGAPREAAMQLATARSGPVSRSRRGGRHG